MLSLNKIDDLYIDSTPTKLIVTNIQDNADIKFIILTSSNLENKDDTIAIIKNDLFYPSKAGVALVYGITSETTNYLSTKTNIIAILIKAPIYRLL